MGIDLVKNLFIVVQFSSVSLLIDEVLFFVILIALGNSEVCGWVGGFGV